MYHFKRQIQTFTAKFKTFPKVMATFKKVYPLFPKVVTTYDYKTIYEVKGSFIVYG